MAEIEKGLQALTETIATLVGEAVSNKTVQPEEELLLQWKVKDFGYNDSGITTSGAATETVPKKSWFRASIALQKRIAEHETYKTALEELKQAYPASPEMERHLERFAGTILNICLSTSGTCATSDMAGATKRFMNDLAGGPVTYKAKVELQGVTLRPERIELDLGLSIRKPRKEDLEAAIHPFGLLEQSLANPSAIVDVEFLGRRGQNRDVQMKVEQCVAILRLFDVGSVRWTRYHMESDSLLDSVGHGALTSGDRAGALERYLIKYEDEPKLKAFWGTMSIAMPKDIYDFQKQISHITLAYDRYSDGLLHNGIIERRIANAVMGLEALLLYESQELSYRLGVRASKLLGLTGKNPLEVRDVIKDAYRIRNTFAHGGHLAYKEKKKLERRYGDVREFLLRLLGYLRCAIIVMILSRASKDELIDLIDDALIDSAKHQQLENRVSGARTIAVG